MFKKIATAIVVLSATSLTLIQTQQPAQASLLGDLGKLFGAVGNAVQGVNAATQPDGSVDLGKLIRVGGQYIIEIDRITESPEPEYPSDVQSRPSPIDEIEEPSYEPDPTEVEEPEYQPEEGDAEESEYSEPEGEYEDASE